MLIATRFVLPIPEQSDSCICWPVKCNAGLYVHESHYTVVFQNDRFIFLILPFTVIISTLPFLLFKKDEFFPVVEVTGKTLSTHLDSFSMFTTAPKNKLKNPAVPPPRCDSGAHVDAAPFWEGRTKGNFQTFHSHSALLGSTASSTFHLGHSIHAFPAPTFHTAKWPNMNWDQNFKEHTLWQVRTDSKRSPSAPEFGHSDKEAVARHLPVSSNLLTSKAALIPTMPYKPAALPTLTLRSEVPFLMCNCTLKSFQPKQPFALNIPSDIKSYHGLLKKKHQNPKCT